jgi:copper chaperone
MCGCATHQNQTTTPSKTVCGAVTLKVEDMTCSHCASTIEKAITAALPGTMVDANPVSKLVSVHGSTDWDTIKAIVSGAGYTPTCCAVTTLALG